MARIWGIIFFAVSLWPLAAGQQTAALTSEQPANYQPEQVKVYSEGPGVGAPKLLSLPPLQTNEAKCTLKPDVDTNLSTVTLSVLVDTEGRARNVVFLRPVGSDLDLLAIQVASADRFKPGTHGGSPSVVGQTLKIRLHACVDENGKKAASYQLRSQPEQELGPLPRAPAKAVLAPIDHDNRPERLQRIGGSVYAPIVIHTAEAHFTPEAQKAKYQGTCIVSVVIDRNGIPGGFRIVKGLDHGLNEKAIEAVKQYRFKPAMKDGEPVPVALGIEVDFRLY